MTDYFALLNQPRRPWLDTEEVKHAFHARALQAHPDAKPQQGTESSSDALFAELNEAYQVLQDPKRRLQHLLTLEGHPPDRASGATPTTIEALFPLVAAATNRATALVKQSAAATNALTRSLLKSELQNASKDVAAVQEKVRELYDTAMACLQRLDQSWDNDSRPEPNQLKQLYLELSYVTRWLQELEEKRLQLSTC